MAGPCQGCCRPRLHARSPRDGRRPNLPYELTVNERPTSGALSIWYETATGYRIRDTYPKPSPLRLMLANHSSDDESSSSCRPCASCAPATGFTQRVSDLTPSLRHLSGYAQMH
jgi:hypothetical protein